MKISLVVFSILLVPSLAWSVYLAPPDYEGFSATFVVEKRGAGDLWSIWKTTWVSPDDLKEQNGLVWGYFLQPPLLGRRGTATVVCPSEGRDEFELILGRGKDLLEMLLEENPEVSDQDIRIRLDFYQGEYFHQSIRFAPCTQWYSYRWHEALSEAEALSVKRNFEGSFTEQVAEYIQRHLGGELLTFDECTQLNEP